MFRTCLIFFFPYILLIVLIALIVHNKIADEAEKVSFTVLLTISIRIIMSEANVPSGLLFNTAKLLSELCGRAWLNSTQCSSWP